MNVVFYNTTNHKKAVTKTLTNGTTYTCNLKEGSNVVNPTIILTGVSEISKNYCNIPSFSRYYFIKEWRIMTGGRMEIDLEVDPLTSFSSYILDSTQLVVRQENIGLNQIKDTNYPIAPYSETRVIKVGEKKFFNSFTNTTDCYLLTVAGK